MLLGLGPSETSFRLEAVSIVVTSYMWLLPWKSAYRNMLFEIHSEFKDLTRKNVTYSINKLYINFVWKLYYLGYIVLNKAYYQN